MPFSLYTSCRPFVEIPALQANYLGIWIGLTLRDMQDHCLLFIDRVIVEILISDSFPRVFQSEDFEYLKTSARNVNSNDDVRACYAYYNSILNRNHILNPF